MLPVLASLLLAAASASADELLAAAKDQLAKHDDVAARKTLEKAKKLAREPKLLAQVQLYLGLAHAAAADEKPAVASFKAALALDRGIELPEDVSPKVIEWWERAGGKRKVVAVEPLPQPEEPKPAPPPVVIIEPAAQPAPQPAPAPVVVEPPPAASRKGPHWGTLLPVGLTAATAAIFGLMYAKANGNAFQLKTGSFNEITAQQLVDEGKVYENIGGAFLALAVAAAVASLVVLIASWK